MDSRLYNYFKNSPQELNQMLAEENISLEKQGDIWTAFGYIEFFKNNIDEAISYYEKAATLGNISAMKSLISFYLMGGDAIAPDREKAQYWKEQLQKVKK